MGTRGVFTSVSPTEGEWYSRLTGGMKLKMGVVRFQNEALTSWMVPAMEDILEGKWLRANSPKRQESIGELMSFILIVFGAGLRGEESPLVSLPGLLHFLDESRLDPDPFIMITLFGRFKGGNRAQMALSAHL